jgi:signal transduction histidine kinase
VVLSFIPLIFRCLGSCIHGTLEKRQQIGFIGVVSYIFSGILFLLLLLVLVLNGTRKERRQTGFVAVVWSLVFLRYFVACIGVRWLVGKRQTDLLVAQVGLGLSS